jgi:hypothetical protein
MSTTSPDGQMFGPVNVIEVRACKNGHVITVFYDRHIDDRPPARGYESHVVEGFDPDKVGTAVAGILREKALEPNVAIHPVRKLP